MNSRSFWSMSKYMEIAVDLMVMHLSCSSFLVSVALVSPALAAAIIPALAARESVKVDLPWSTCAITDMFLMLAFLSIHSRTWSTVKFTILKPFLFYLINILRSWVLSSLGCIMAGGLSAGVYVTN